jgi:hypothetical protein
MPVVRAVCGTLETHVAPVDTLGMSEATAVLNEQQELICVLAAYRAAEQADPVHVEQPAVAVEAAEPGVEAVEAESDTSWIPRLRELPGVAGDRLALLHGQLIAHGLLRFNLLGRTAGVGYRVTPEGRQLLASNRV